LKDAKEIGHITSSLKSETLGGVIALGYIKYGFFDSGNEVEVETKGERLPAKVVELPFYKHL
jgi:aminomethyltransferase